MFTAGISAKYIPETVDTKPQRALGPISESDFFAWEALICGPKDTPFVGFATTSCKNPFDKRNWNFQEGGVFVAKLTFVR